MPDLTFVTGNAAKFHIGNSICTQYGIKLRQTTLDIPELQAEDGMVIARDKVRLAYENLLHPVLVSDDSWLIPGLNNFPGPYMKSMNTWFTPEDWLRLTCSLQNRKIILRVIVAYQDAHVQKLFCSDINGVLLKNAVGTSKFTHTTITSFNNGSSSLAEDIAAGRASSDVPGSAWHQFAKWHTEITA
ncbi:MAG TPA: non-canonical purine NTP pyrophosphatase [Candidatus Saccharimonadales bacterium]|jgi:inosine/xanthosine triphosphate pyrophosphatase family protein